MVISQQTNLKPLAIIFTVLTIYALQMTLPNYSVAADKGEKNMAETQHYFVQLLGTREGWPEDMTDEEVRVMEEHYEYLKNLTLKKKVLAAGPCFDGNFGLIILQTSSKDEAIEIMENEPSVVSGVHTYEIQAMKVSLFADYSNPLRYPRETSDRILVKQIEVSASIDTIWHAWTTTEGIQSFFSPYADIDLRVGGPFEIYFSLDVPYGLRGSEDCKILSYLPKKMFSFEWGAPPSFGELRNQRTQVILEFEDLEPMRTRVTLSQLGWGKGEKWNELYDYFDKAWESVLSSLKKSFKDHK
ncbi:MAG: hypothetical protein GF315_08100 [candidate division Zixibacteria bacterium]|nr:hypothetical protein [candidate division Zixibacteria bacterium]